MVAVSVRLLGRGGQGIKSAAHILGTAAFLSGKYVQDQPVYGAERRGAPVSAFVRISDEPILERGHLASPSVLAVAEESLLADASINPISDTAESTVILLNTQKTAADAASRYGLAHRTEAADLSGLAESILGSNALVSVALAAAAAKMIGLAFNDVEKSLETELRNLRITAAEMVQNMALAKESFDRVQQPRLADSVQNAQSGGRKVIELQYHDPRVSTCSVLAPANTASRRAGDWSKFKPIIDLDKCTKCMICFVYCPDSAITIDNESKFPVVDYRACKGCNICFTECPAKAIRMERKKQ